MLYVISNPTEVTFVHLFIKNFLKNRKIEVRLGDTLSSEYSLDNGPLQGSILSPILFILIINYMFKNAPDVEKSLFFDDGLAWTTGADLHTALEKMQNVLDTISAWGPKLGIKFSTTKTKYMIFKFQVSSFLLVKKSKYINS